MLFKHLILYCPLLLLLAVFPSIRVFSMGWEDPLEKEMAAHSSILTWKIPWISEPGRLPSMGLQTVGHD